VGTARFNISVLFGSRVSHSLRYRPEIDGLRALAVLSVICFHADFSWCKGGFIGVDVFFVLSGYLITSLLEAELERGSFSLRGFYERRIRRIFPALTVMALTCTLVAGVVFSPQVFADFGKSLLAMAGFVSNLYFRVTNLDRGGYFGKPPEPQPLLHTWSIAIEEQFYLLFPALLLLLHRFGRRAKQVVLFSLLGLSFALSVWQSNHQQINGFYLLPGRAWEFLVGAVLTEPYLRGSRHRWVRESAALAGLLAIGFAAATYTGATPFPGVAALLPCLGTALVVFAGNGHDAEGSSSRTLGTSLLRWPPLVLVGVMSYSLYLWHWPVLVFAGYISPKISLQMLNSTQLAKLFALGFVLAFLSYRFVELPFRLRSKPLSRYTFSAALASTAVLVALGAVLVGSRGLPHRFSAHTEALIEANEASKAIQLPKGECDNFDPNPARYEEAVFCKFGNSPHNVLLWGDSHVYMLIPLLRQMQREGDLGGKGVVTAVLSACPLAEHMNVPLVTRHCDLFASMALRRALEPDIDTVYIGMSPWWFMGNTVCASVNGQCVRTLSQAEEIGAYMEEFSREVRLLTGHGKRVVLSLQFPGYFEYIPNLDIRNAILRGWAAPKVPSPQPLLLENALQTLAATEHLRVFDPRRSLCPNQRCIYQIDGVSIYQDESHLALNRLGLVRENLKQALAGPVPPANTQPGTPAGIILDRFNRGRFLGVRSPGCCRSGQVRMIRP
jgi:peptidoglycan/LPS O-acetylase OafA/YrhL